VGHDDIVAGLFLTFSDDALDALTPLVAAYQNLGVTSPTQGYPPDSPHVP